MHKNITRYTKSTLAIILLFMSTVSTFAKNMHNIHYNTQDITFDTRISAGVQSMVANECVYHPYTGDKLSRLIWDTSSLAMVGLGGSLHFQERYTFNIDYWFSANKSNTKMTDYDYLIPNFDWTHRSIHKNTDVSSASMFDTSAEFNTYKLSNTNISALLGYRQETSKRKAYGGTLVYSDLEHGGFRNLIGTIPNNLLVITYAQTWKSPYIGFKAHTDITNQLTLHSKFIYAPVVKGETKDNHHLRDKVTTDSLDNTNMYALDLGLEYKFSTALSLNLNYMYQKYNTTKGDSKLTIEGEILRYNNISGADLKTSRFSLSMNYKF